MTSHPHRVVNIANPNQKLGVRLNPITATRVQVTMVAANTLASQAGVTAGDFLHSIHLPKPQRVAPQQHDFTTISLADTHLAYEDLLQLLRETRPLVVEFEQGKGGNEVVEKAEAEESKVKVKVKMTKEERRVMFAKAVDAGDEKTIAALGVGGIPEEIRSNAWKVLLKYYAHCRRQDWAGIQRSHLDLYREYKKEFLGVGPTRPGQGPSRRPSRLTGQGWWERGDEAKVRDEDTYANSVEVNLQDDEAKTKEADGGGSTSPLAVNESIPVVEAGESSEQLKRDIAHDDPLFSPAAGVAPSPSPSRAQTKHAPDEEKCDRDLREEIWKDVQRTHPGLHFFTEKTYGSLERILFIFAKLNPGIRYVQGMNEILAPIFYVVMNEKDASNEADGGGCEEQREADAFFCFCNLMGEIRELYIKELDDDSSSNGLKGRMDAFATILQRCDPPLARRMEQLQLRPQYYALRWFTTLLAREFELPEAVRLWDSLFSDPHRFEFLLYVCLAILQRYRAFVMKNDFATCMKKLQSPPDVEMNQLLREAYALVETDAQILTNLSTKPMQPRYKPATVTKWIRDSFTITSAHFHKP